MADARARLGARVRQIRIAQGKTQEDIAERSGLSYKFIGEVERGAANPSLGTLESLARGLNVQIGDFFPASSSPGDELYPPHEREQILVREIADSLERLLGRLQRARVRRPRKKSRK